MDFIIGFLGVTYARAVAAPLNPNYRPVRLLLSMLLLTPSLRAELSGADAGQQQALCKHVQALQMAQASMKWSAGFVSRCHCGVGPTEVEVTLDNLC